MERANALEVLFISLNQSIPFIGKLWLVVFLLLRVFILLFAGFPLYWDERELFICNTIHPGCASVCFDAFAPLSLCRFGFLHLVCVCLPTVLYVTQHTHRAFAALTRQNFMQEHTLPLKCQLPYPRGTAASGGGFGGKATGLYLLQLILRIFLELAFGVGQYFLFGVSVSWEFQCLRVPCSATVECFTSRPTEKTFLMWWMLGNVVLSVTLSIAEMLIWLSGSVQERKHRRRKKLEEKNNGERKSENEYIHQANSVDKLSIPLGFAFLPFRKRKPRYDPTLIPSLTPKSSLSRWSDARPSHMQAPEERSEQEGSEVTLCSTENTESQKGHCGRNGSIKAQLPMPLTSNRPKAEPWSPSPTGVWRRGLYTPVATTPDHTSDSSESQDRKAWV